MVLFTEERLPLDALRISPESYATRKEVALKRLQSMNEYMANTSACRSQLIQRYFGETDATPCGVCDWCIERRKHDTSDDPLRHAILDRLKQHAESVRTLTSTLHGNSQRVVEMVTTLLNEQKIVEDNEGKLRINP